VRCFFYSGDTDGAVPTWGTRQWIKELNWDKKLSTTPWYVDNQFEGEIERYDGLDFATIHGVGHLCPQWKRFQVLSLMTAWLHNEDNLFNFYSNDFHGQKKAVQE
jgi:hypothetical protein